MTYGREDLKPREQYLEVLGILKSEIMKMGILVEESLNNAMAALRNQDVILAAKIIDNDLVIDGLELEIEDRSIALIATEQPVAGDLRHVITGMRIVTQLERMGDYSVNIARSIFRLKDRKLKTTLMAGIIRMCELCIGMNREVLSAFLDDDPDKAEKTAGMDRDVDAMYVRVQEDIFTAMAEDPAFLPQAMEFTMISRVLERYADHIVNTCEWIVYGRTGKRVDLG
jgi:phosphate transport system protein